MAVDNFIIRGDRVLIKEINESQERAKATGIVIAETQGEMAQRGVVIMSNVEGVKEGDEVVYNKFVPQEIRIEDETYYMIDSVDILMVKAKGAK